MGRIGAADSISVVSALPAYPSEASTSPYRRCDQHTSRIGAVDNVQAILVQLTYQPCWRKTYQPYWPTDRATRESTLVAAMPAPDTTRTPTRTEIATPGARPRRTTRGVCRAAGVYRPSE